MKNVKSEFFPMLSIRTCDFILSMNNLRYLSE